MRQVRHPAAAVRPPGTGMQHHPVPAMATGQQATPREPTAADSAGNLRPTPPRIPDNARRSTRAASVADAFAPLGSTGGLLRPAAAIGSATVAVPAGPADPTREAAPRAASRLLAERMLSVPARPAVIEDPADTFAAQLDDDLWLEGGE